MEEIVIQASHEVTLTSTQQSKNLEEIPLKIFDIINKKFYSIHVPQSASVRDLKKILYLETSIPILTQRLVFPNLQLLNDVKIADLQIPEGRYIYLHISPFKYVLKVTGKYKGYICLPHEDPTINDLESYLKEYFKADNLSMFYRGRILKSNGPTSTLKHLQIQTGSVIFTH
jgi:hypothetical protein